jgi:hypothetical protein
MFYLRDLKEDGLVVFKHIPGSENEADIFTKNVDAVTLHKHVTICVVTTTFMSCSRMIANLEARKGVKILF